MFGAVAWMLVCHPARGLVLLAAAAEPSCDPDTLNVAVRAWVLSTNPIPVPLGTVVWQAKQSARLVLSPTRKLPVGSVF